MSFLVRRQACGGNPQPPFFPNFPGNVRGKSKLSRPTHTKTNTHTQTQPRTQKRDCQKETEKNIARAPLVLCALRLAQVGFPLPAHGIHPIASCITDISLPWSVDSLVVVLRRLEKGLEKKLTHTNTEVHRHTPLPAARYPSGPHITSSHSSMANAPFNRIHHYKPPTQTQQQPLSFLGIRSGRRSACIP